MVIAKSILAAWFNSREKGACTAVWNPDTSTRTSYLPIGRRGRTYVPSLLLCVFHTVPRSASVAVTAALGMAAPDGSVTVPVRLAVTSWPRTNAELSKIKAASASTVHAMREEPREYDAFVFINTPSPLKTNFRLLLSLILGLLRPDVQFKTVVPALWKGSLQYRTFLVSIICHHVSKLIRATAGPVSRLPASLRRSASRLHPGSRTAAGPSRPVQLCRF